MQKTPFTDWDPLQFEDIMTAQDESCGRKVTAEWRSKLYRWYKLFSAYASLFNRVSPFVTMACSPWVFHLHFYALATDKVSEVHSFRVVRTTSACLCVRPSLHFYIFWINGDILMKRETINRYQVQITLTILRRSSLVWRSRSASDDWKTFVNAVAPLTVVTYEMKLTWNNFEIISVCYFTCNHCR